MKIEIKRWYDDKILFSHDCDDNTIAITLTKAVADGASLDGASLDGASLDGASLDGARLDGASLDGARLDGASLDGARLVRASLDGASLVRASLVRASLVRASLDGARLDGARLDGASLDGARLDGASLVECDLTNANLTPIRDDIWAVLSSAPLEVQGLIDALKAGRVDGSTYTGECSCLVGTLANVRNTAYNTLPTLVPNSERPAERFFMGIKKGDTPETNQVSRLALEWSEQWLATMRAAFQAAHTNKPTA